jgi:hypothetical protein
MSEHPPSQRLRWDKVCSILAGLFFFYLCMLLPLVGPAGSRQAHAAENQTLFMSILGVTFLLSVSAALLQWRSRKVVQEEGIPAMLTFSIVIALIGICCLSGWLAV